VFEAEEQKKEIWHFFQIPKPTDKVEATLVSSGRPLEDRSKDRLLVLAETRRMQAGSSVSKTPAQLTLATKENCFVLSVGKQDTLPKNVYLINFPPEGTRERMGTPNHRKRGKSSRTYAEAARRNNHRQENL
jgi:hypothetical protein